MRILHRTTAIVATAVENVAKLLLQQAAEAHLVLAFEDVGNAFVGFDPRHEIIGDPFDAGLAMKGPKHRIAFKRHCARVGVALQIGIDRVFARRGSLKRQSESEKEHRLLLGQKLAWSESNAPRWRLIVAMSPRSV